MGLPTLTLLLAAVGFWLMLPRGTSRGRLVGTVLAVVALGLGGSRMPLLGQWMADGMFVCLAAITVVSAGCAVTFRNPVYCAIWFGMSLLGTAGLFLLSGAQFLAVATIIVYAGAILVTFLFVLMLAQPEGKASYDRVSWEAPLAAAAGMVMVGVLSLAIGSVLAPVPAVKGDAAPSVLAAAEVATAIAREEAMSRHILSPDHVAGLGRELFGRHLIALEVAGMLLFVALVGAAVIVAQGRGEREPDGGER
mgnify:FL=1